MLHLLSRLREEYGFLSLEDLVKHHYYLIKPGPGIEPGSSGYAPKARAVKLSETSSVTTFQSNNFLFNTITEKYLLRRSTQSSFRDILSNN
ncbi:Protein of unknown function [Cotesia congregata]|uniref:Uncharacterized protein n=1 Tax=Cotesia congregata TaxID=51543 RepID=A0A8J2EBD8_COTCN|nr:Protein of unknown function [Cotesia congregata]